MSSFKAFIIAPLIFLIIAWRAVRLQRGLAPDGGGRVREHAALRRHQLHRGHRHRGPGHRQGRSVPDEVITYVDGDDQGYRDLWRLWGRGDLL